MKADAEGIDGPFVELRVRENHECYSPESGTIERVKLVVDKLGSSDTAKLSAWCGKQISLHNPPRRSFCYFDLEQYDDDHEEKTTLMFVYRPDRNR